jgi:hypothetical protein
MSMDIEDMTPEVTEARTEYVDELAGLMANAIQAGVTEEMLRSDFEAQLSLQFFGDDPTLNMGRPKPRTERVVWDYSTTPQPINPAAARYLRTNQPCPCACNHGGFCGGCGHAGCGGR